jgi:G3E family GTPase
MSLARQVSQIGITGWIRARQFRHRHFRGILPGIMQDSDTIPVVLLTGCLGAGKTTLLNAILASDCCRNLDSAVVINEFSTVGIDGQLLVPGRYSKYELNKGSIFCICTKTELLSVFMELEKSRPDMVLVEATGVAEPRDLGSVIDIPQLAGAFAVTLNICLVDPLVFFKIRETLPAVAAQVRDADVVAVNKCDLASEPQIRAAEAEVQALNPRAEVLRTTHARLPLSELLQRRCRHEWQRELRTAPPEGVKSVSIESNRVMRRRPFYELLEQWRDHILRAKGRICFPDRPLFVEVAGGRLSSRPLTAIEAAVHPRKTQFVLVLRDLDPEDVARQLAACEVPPAQD